MPCLVINLTALNYSLQNPSYTFTGGVFNFALIIFNTLFIVGATLFYSEGMLLGSWTVFIVFLCLELGFFNIPIKLLSIVILLTMSLKKCCFEVFLFRFREYSFDSYSSFSPTTFFPIRFQSRSASCNSSSSISSSWLLSL